MAYTPPSPSGSPISSIPDELVFVILSESITSSTSDKDYAALDIPFLLTLMKVCRRWHIVIASEPRLWAAIDFRWWTATDTLLLRSGTAPLSINWFMDTYYNDNVVASEKGANIVALMTALDSALAQFQRIRDLRLGNNDLCQTHDYWIFDQAMQMIPSHSDFLETLSISWMADDGVFPEPLPLHYASRLRALRLENVRLPEISSRTFPQLRILEIKTCEWKWSLGAILAFLSCMKHLELLRLSSDGIRTFAPAASLTDEHELFQFPNLASIEIIDFPVDCPILSLTSHISPAGGCNLEIKIGDDIHTAVHPLTLLNELFASLHSFETKALKVRHVELVDRWDHGTQEGRITVHFMDGSPLGRLSVKYPDIFGNSYAHESSDVRLLRKGRTLGHLLKNTCNPSYVHTLDAFMSLTPTHWPKLLNPCKTLQKIRLSAHAALGFINGMIEAETHTERKPFLPALETLCIEEGASGAMLFAGVILSKIIIVLELRGASGRHLKELIIDTLAVIDEAEGMDSWWEQETNHEYLSTIREWVPVTIRRDGVPLGGAERGGSVQAAFA